MEKIFKKGDKVLRINGDYDEAVEGEIYEVSKINGIGNAIDLVGHKSGCGHMCRYSASSFRLVEEASIMTIHQAVDHLLAGDTIQYLNSVGKWQDIQSGTDISIAFLAENELRLKPKTVTVNGIEVPAPMTDDEIINCGDRRKGYCIDLAHRRIYNKRILVGEIAWSKKGDAQQVLDAMLIPFKTEE